MPRVNILKQVRVGDHWKLVSIPKNRNGRNNWKSLPEGLYFIEWYERGKRKRQAGGVTVAEVMDAARRKKHSLDLNPAHCESSKVALSLYPSSLPANMLL